MVDWQRLLGLVVKIGVRMYDSRLWFGINT